MPLVRSCLHSAIREEGTRCSSVAFRNIDEGKERSEGSRTHPPHGRQPSVCWDNTDPQPPKRGLAQP